MSKAVKRLKEINKTMELTGVDRATAIVALKDNRYDVTAATRVIREVHAKEIADDLPHVPIKTLKFHLGMMAIKSTGPYNAVRCVSTLLNKHYNTMYREVSTATGMCDKDVTTAVNRFHIPCTAINWSPSPVNSISFTLEVKLVKLPTESPVATS